MLDRAAAARRPDRPATSRRTGRSPRSSPRCQGGPDHAGHVLGPVGRVHHRLGPRRQAGVRGVEQQRPQPHARSSWRRARGWRARRSRGRAARSPAAWPGSTCPRPRRPRTPAAGRDRLPARARPGRPASRRAAARSRGRLARRSAAASPRNAAVRSASSGTPGPVVHLPVGREAEQRSRRRRRAAARGCCRRRGR